MDNRKKKAFLWVLGEVDKISPPGLGGWMPAWESTALENELFLLAVLAWDGSKEEGQRIKTAGADVIEAWRKAGEAFLQKDGAG